MALTPIFGSSFSVYNAVRELVGYSCVSIEGMTLIVIEFAVVFSLMWMAALSRWTVYKAVVPSGMEGIKERLIGEEL
jgi:hypothetical protein